MLLLDRKPGTSPDQRSHGCMFDLSNESAAMSDHHAQLVHPCM